VNFSPKEVASGRRLGKSLEVLTKTICLGGEADEALREEIRHEPSRSEENGDNRGDRRKASLVWHSRVALIQSLHKKNKKKKKKKKRPIAVPKKRAIVPKSESRVAEAQSPNKTDLYHEALAFRGDRCQRAGSHYGGGSIFLIV